eukprot:jgi/Ulvmu1/2392/UM131_0003.1
MSVGLRMPSALSLSLACLATMCVLFVTFLWGSTSLVYPRGNMMPPARRQGIFAPSIRTVSVAMDPMEVAKPLVPAEVPEQQEQPEADDDVEDTVEAATMSVLEEANTAAGPPCSGDDAATPAAAESGCTAIWGDPGCPEEVDPMSEEAMDELLHGESDLHGAVTKAGPLPVRLWWPPNTDPEGPAHQHVRDWLWQSTLGGIDGRLPPSRGEVAPRVDKCMVLINPIYKFIFIKNTKVAGSSVFESLGGMCPPEITFERAKERGPCWWTTLNVHKVGVESLGYESLQAMWADFTVFTITRNVYDRAGSAYDYLLGLRANRKDDCQDPEFQHFAARPYVVGLQSQVFDCGNVIHDLVHVEPQHTCLADDSGALVMDYIMRVSSLDVDFALTLGAINSKRPDGLPPLNTTLGWKQKGPLAQASGKSVADSDTDEPAVEPEVKHSRHLKKYVDCGARCFGLIHEYYRQDFELLHYPVGDVFVTGF